MSYTLISVDPGMNNLGYAYSEVDDNGNFTVGDYGCLSPSKYDTSLKKDRKYFTDRILTGKVIRDMTLRMIEKYHPDFFCSEDAFFNPSRPNAYANLLITIFGIESCLYKHYCTHREIDYRSCLLYKIPPTLVKKVFDMEQGGKAGKTDMYMALAAHAKEKHIKFKKHPAGWFPKENTITEHSVDAIGIGYAFSRIWYPIIVSSVLDKHCTSINKFVRKRLKEKKFKTLYL